MGSVRGREVIKIVPGSQAEKLGVQLGWQISHVNGKEMPASGQIAADGITKALAAGKKRGKRYSIKFSAPGGGGGAAAAAGKGKSPRGWTPLAAAKSGAMGSGGAAAASTQLPSVMSSRGSPASSKKSSKPSTTAAFGAFGAFSSGLGAVGMSQEKLLQAHQSMAKLNEEMA